MTDYRNLSAMAGRKLKETIKAKGFTQVEFASLIGVEESTLRKWLAYGIDSIDKLNIAAKKLQVPIYYFINNG